jgi:hypothetical protein
VTPSGGDSMNDPRDQQLAFNAQTLDRWDAYAGHRRKVSELLRAGMGNDPGRLCILGAGNCNDLDLAALLATYREVHLVDWDDSSLARGAARQGVAGHPGLHLLGGIDVTGMLDSIRIWSPRSPIGDGDLASCADNPVRSVGPSLPGSFDFVASTCLLSQLVGSLVNSAGEGHPRFVELVQAIRAGHLRLLMRLLRPGGAAALITDIVSSETCPMLRSAPESSLGELLAGLLRDRNFFHGVNPMVLSSIARRDPVLSVEVASQELLPPWLWDIDPRVYLVWAMKYRKRDP